MNLNERYVAMGQRVLIPGVPVYPPRKKKVSFPDFSNIPIFVNFFSLFSTFFSADGAGPLKKAALQGDTATVGPSVSSGAVTLPAAIRILHPLDFRTRIKVIY